MNPSEKTRERSARIVPYSITLISLHMHAFTLLNIKKLTSIPVISNKLRSADWCSILGDHFKPPQMCSVRRDKNGKWINDKNQWSEYFQMFLNTDYIRRIGLIRSTNPNEVCSPDRYNISVCGYDMWSDSDDFRPPEQKPSMVNWSNDLSSWAKSYASA